MKPKMKALLKTLAVVDLEIEGEEFELDVEEILDLEGKDLDTIHERIGVLSALEGFLRQTVEDAKTELAFFEADKDENIRNDGSARRENAILAQIRTDPEWVEKRRNKAISRRELDIVMGLKEALFAKIDVKFILMLGEIGTSIASKKLREEDLVGLIVNKYGKIKKKKIEENKEKKKKEKKKKKKNKNIGGSRRYTDQADVLDEDDLSEDIGHEDFENED